MDSVLRAAAIYLVVLVVFRLAGRRTLSELTTFDFVLLLIIGKAFLASDCIHGAQGPLARAARPATTAIDSHRCILLSPSVIIPFADLSCS